MKKAKQKLNWKELRQYLLTVQKEFEERNGLPYCKNCGTDFKKLVRDFEFLLAGQKKEFKKVVKGKTISFKEVEKNDEYGCFDCYLKFNQILDNILKAIKDL